MMNILIAPDSFKNSLTANQAAQAMAKGIEMALPDAMVRKIPLADGGEGFVSTMIDALGGQFIKLDVHDALGRSRSSFYGIINNGTAVIEMAAASGIEHLATHELDPLVASTFGTGELLLDAMKQGCRKVIIGIGGSATNDGGVGMAKALGYRFLDANGREIPEGGGFLDQLSTIDQSQVTPLLNEVEIRVACDVSNPLTGPQGASTIYGPQKGADVKKIELLDRNLRHLALIIKSQMKLDVLTIPGGGAAGGLGAGLVAFAGGRLESGFDIVKEQTQLELAVIEADVVVTAEGKIDGQTNQGKTPWGVAQIAKKHKKPCIAFAGGLGKGYKNLHDEGFTALFSIQSGPDSLEFCMENAFKLLSEKSEEVFRLLQAKNN